jgi:hypothetical protein
MKKIYTLVGFAAMLLLFRSASAQGTGHYVELNIFIKDAVVWAPPFGFAHGDGRDVGQWGTSRVTQGFYIFTGSGNVGVVAPWGSESRLTDNSGNTTSLVPDLGSCRTEATYPDSNTVVVTMTGNPRNPHIALAPGITYTIRIIYKKSTDTFTIEYNTDKFPSFEVKIDGVVKLFLPETFLFNLIPIFPNNLGTVPVTTSPVPYIQPLGYFNDLSSFVLQRPSMDVRFLDPYVFGDTVFAKIGPITVLDYQTPAGNFVSWND